MLSGKWLKVALVGLGLAVVPASFAFADSGTSSSKAIKEGGEKAKKFPMPAAEFQKHVEARIAKRKDKLTEKMAERKVPADKQKEVLAEFEAGSTKVRAAAAQAGKDGTVTLDEAKDVHKVAKEQRKEIRSKLGKKGKKGKGAGGA